jgi:hypothetical protein
MMARLIRRVEEQSGDAKEIRESVIPKSQRVSGQAEAMIQAIAKAAGEEAAPGLDLVEEAQIVRCCGAVNPKSSAPLIMAWDPNGAHKYATWGEYLLHYRQRSRTVTEEIREFRQFLEPRHLLLSSQIEECAYFMQLEALQRWPCRNTDCSFLASSMWAYVRTARELKDYAVSFQRSPGG